MGDNSDTLGRLVRHDGVIHHPLGGGSYIFKSNFVDYLAESLCKNDIRISIGAQPNSSPHLGTLVVSCLAFSLGEQIKSKKNNIEVFFEVIDTAPSDTKIVDGNEYQISLRKSKEADIYLRDYFELFEYLSSLSKIPYVIRRQEEFNSHEQIPRIVKKIIAQKDEITPILDPEGGTLRIRVACQDCGLTDKKGIHNKFSNDFIESYCPEHGVFRTNIDQESYRLEYNTPLRNLVRALVFAEDNRDKNMSYEWLRVTGGDYAGFYQEQLLYGCASLLGYPAHILPKIIYSPLVVDWSGAKLSKSLYVQKNAYKYLPPYLVNYYEFKEKLGSEGIEKVFHETTLWLKEPYRLFRNYSVYYFMEMFGYDK